jgi:hypothetical protein
MKNMKQISMKEHISGMGYDFEEIYNNIFLINNFLTEEDVRPLWKIINNATQEDWEEDYRNSQKALALRKYGRDDIDTLISEGIMEYTHDWSDKAIAIPQEYTKNLNKKISEIFKFDTNLWYGDIDTIQRQYSGSELREHIDSDGDPDILYAVIGYLNDDYLDGELYFSNIGIKIRPPKNSIIIFPDGKDYKHGVAAPGDGPLRYALPTFVRHISHAPSTHQE